MTNVLKSYTQTEVITSDPLKLVLLLYDACLKHLLKTRDAIKTQDIQARGENLGKAIAILNELINSLSGDKENEAVQFLHGLYMAIIRELGKVPVTNDLSTVELAIKYIAQLRHIWKEHVMKEGDSAGSRQLKMTEELKKELKRTHKTTRQPATYTNLGAFQGVL